MWKIWHRLFGWHYAHFEDSATEIIRRIRVSPSGKLYAVYFASHLIWLDRLNDDGWRMTPLTWSEDSEQKPLRLVS